MLCIYMLADPYLVREAYMVGIVVVEDRNWNKLAVSLGTQKMWN